MMLWHIWPVAIALLITIFLFLIEIRRVAAHESLYLVTCFFPLQKKLSVSFTNVQFNLKPCKEERKRSDLVVTLEAALCGAVVLNCIIYRQTLVWLTKHLAQHQKHRCWAVSSSSLTIHSDTDQIDFSNLKVGGGGVQRAGFETETGRNKPKKIHLLKTTHHKCDRHLCHLGVF